MLTGNNMAKNLQPKETSSKIKSVKNIKEPLLPENTNLLMVSSLLIRVESEFDSIGILTNVRICNFEIWGLSVPECKPFKSFA